MAPKYSAANFRFYGFATKIIFGNGCQPGKRSRFILSVTDTEFGARAELGPGEVKLQLAFVHTLFKG